MSDTVNPFQSPETAAVPEKPLAAQGTLTETMLIYLKGAAPWLQFMGILGFIGSGFTALWGVAMIALVPLLRQVWDQVPEFEVVGNFLGVAFGGTLAVLCIGGAVVLFFPAFFTYNFGRKIRGYLMNGKDADLEAAFKNNKSLWKFLGIISIIELAFIPLLIIGGIIVAVVMAISS